MAHESKLCGYHHGIYIGGGFVIDYNDDSKICRIRLTEFKDGTSLFRVSYINIVKPLDPETVIRKAKAALKTPTQNITHTDYCLMIGMFYLVKLNYYLTSPDIA